MSIRQAISQLQENMKKEIVGQEEIIESLVIGLLALYIGRYGFG